MTLIILRALLFIAEALALSTLLPLLVFSMAWALRRRAALRHMLWLAAFAMLLLLPTLTLIVPSHIVLAQAPLAALPALPVTVAMAAPVTATYASQWSFDNIVALLFAPFCAIWFLGVCWNLMRLGLGAYGLRRLRHRSEFFDRVQNCEIRLADGGPLTYGCFRPVILLPHAARRWSRARLDAVLRHELAHVRRKDSLTQTLAQLVCAFYWPNPLVWLAARALRREAEIAADDTVLASGVKPSSYAAELLRLAGEFQLRPRFAGVAMAAPSALESRVTAILSPVPSRKGATVMDACKIALLGSCATALLLVARPSFAEVSKPVPPPVPLAAPAPAEPPAPPAPPAPVRHIHSHASADASDSDQKVRTSDGTMVTDDDGVKVETRFHHVEGLSPQEREKIHQAMLKVKVELDGIHPQIEQAMAQAHASMAQAREMRATANVSAQAWRQAAAEIHQAVRQAMDEIRPYIREASRDPQAGDKVGRKVDEAMAKVQPQIDAAIARANEARVPVIPPVPPMPAMPPVPPAQEH